MPTCGLVPLRIAPYALAITLLIASWFPGLAGVTDALSGASSTRVVVNVAVTLALGFLLARLFCAPAAVTRAWTRAGATDVAKEGDNGAIHRALANANRRSIVLIGALAVLGGHFPLFDLAVIGATLIDVAGEVRARLRSALLVPVRPLHRVYAVEPVLRALSEAGVNAFARARHFRALYHFFAPYAPIEIIAPPESAEAAEAICARIVSSSAP